MQDFLNNEGPGEASEKDKWKVYLELYRQANPIVNDAYDRLVAGIHLHKKKSKYTTFTVTGCGPGTGTTTIAISLAISMANSGWKTVLIDADMRKDRFCKRLNENIQFGLSHYLANTVPVEMIFCETNFSNLQYISCGDAEEKAVEFLCSSNFDKLLGYIKEKYDIAVLDSPSLNATVDASILASKTDAVILVAEQNKTKRSQILAAKRELDNVGANLLGIVLNRVEKAEYKHYLKNYNYFQIFRPAKKRRKK